jgi:branched-chain amino acid transport system ATP-binding protein
MENSLQTNQEVMSLDKISKKFGGIVADNQVSFKLYEGKIHGLIGPNGSGKSTTLNLISGIYNVDSGSISLNENLITNLSIYDRARKGIARSFQTPRLLKRCDIKTNIFLGMDLARRKRLSSIRSIQDNDRLKELMEVAGLKGDLNDSIEKLSYGEQKMLEIVRALLTKPKVLLLDEPAAGLNHKEMEKVIGLIDIAVKENTAVLFVEHTMDLVMSLCDDITVLNFGCVIAEGVPEEIQSNPVVIEAYIGSEKNA